MNAPLALDTTHSLTQCSAPFITCHSSSVFLTCTSHHSKLVGDDISWDIDLVMREVIARVKDEFDFEAEVSRHAKVNI